MPGECRVITYYYMITILSLCTQAKSMYVRIVVDAEAAACRWVTSSTNLHSIACQYRQNGSNHNFMKMILDD